MNHQTDVYVQPSEEPHGVVIECGSGEQAARLADALAASGYFPTVDGRLVCVAGVGVVALLVRLGWLVDEVEDAV